MSKKKAEAKTVVCPGPGCVLLRPAALPEGYLTGGLSGGGPKAGWLDVPGDPRRIAVYDKYAGYVFKVDGETYVSVRTDDILAYWDPD